MILGEGLETCLSWALEFAPVWSCLDAGNLGGFPLLPGIESVTILIDNDPAGERAFAALSERYEAAGRGVLGVRAAEAGADLNDLATKAA